MKKIFFLCLAILLPVSMCASFADLDERDVTYYSEMNQGGLDFLSKFGTCSPAVNKETGEIVRGMTKNGNCSYVFPGKKLNLDVIYDCTLPMRAVIGYTSTAQDVRDYAESNPEIAEERLMQNNEIRKIMTDYCKIRVKYL